MKLMPKRLKYRVDVPYQETPTALHVKGVGVLEKLRVEPTNDAQPPHAVYDSYGGHLDCGAGVMSIRGFGVVLMCMAVVGLVFGTRITTTLFQFSDKVEGGHWFVLGSLLLFPLLLLGFYQALMIEAAPVRDFFFRFSRRTGRLYEWTPDRTWSAKFDELVPVHHRVSAGTIVNGDFYLVDLDRERQVVRRLYGIAPRVLSSPDGSQIHYEYLRRYMAGEFDKMRPVQRAPLPVRGFVGIARGFAPARWGRAIQHRWGHRAIPLQVVVTTIAGLLLGLPWAFATLADMRLPLPKWSDVDEAERRDGAIGRQEEELPQPLVYDDPAAEQRQRHAPWEAPFYAVVMAAGAGAWLYGLSIPIRMILAL